MTTTLGSTLFFSRLQQQGISFSKAEDFYASVMNHPWAWVHLDGYNLRARFSPTRNPAFEVEAVPEDEESAFD